MKRELIITFKIYRGGSTGDNPDLTVYGQTKFDDDKKEFTFEEMGLMSGMWRIKPKPIKHYVPDRLEEVYEYRMRWEDLNKLFPNPPKPVKWYHGQWYNKLWSR